MVSVLEQENRIVTNSDSVKKGRKHQFKKKSSGEGQMMYVHHWS